MNVTPLRVLVADDYFAFRQGLKVLLGYESDIQVVGEASSGRQLVELVRLHQPDAVVMDLSMGSLSGTELIRQVLSVHAQTKILVLSGHSEPRVVNEALACGAHGYLAKSTSLRQVPIALRELRRGGSFVRVGREAGAVENLI